MKNIVLISIICGLLFASACSKNSSTSTRAQFQWTYAGATFTADTVVATNANSVVSYYELYAQTGPWATPSTAFTAEISSFSPGSYGTGGTNNFTQYVSATGNNQITPFSITITSNSNNLLNGNFTGTLNGQTITGSFTNVQIH